MSKFEAQYQNYDHYEGVSSIVTIKDTNIKKLTVSYDGGRLYISVNGEELYENLGFGCDACISFTKIND